MINLRFDCDFNLGNKLTSKSKLQIKLIKELRSIGAKSVMAFPLAKFIYHLNKNCYSKRGFLCL